MMNTNQRISESALLLNLVAHLFPEPVPPQEQLHLLLLLEAEEGEAVSEGVEDDFWVLVDGGVDDALVEEEVLLRQEVE